jgi:uncharacterized membrane protein YfcA
MLVTAAILGLVTVTSFISGLFGVAGGIVLMGGLIYVLPVAQAMVLHGVAQIVSNVARVYIWRRYILLPVVLRFIGASLVAAGVFALVRFVPSKPVLLLILGLSTVTSMLVPEGWVPKITDRGVAYMCGFMASALQLTAGVSGTFLDQFFQRAKLDRRVVVATKAAMQVFQHGLKVVYFGAVALGPVDDRFTFLLLAVPAITLLTATLASRLLERMTDAHFNWWTRRIVLVCGTYFTLDGFRLLLFAA